ncbi:hypothetical protein GDO78_015917 [Eleutherodactylus coqui]|uniref:Uncharacterized protein n=1 Tax=Eleutherodactylus coqui TaxID=57060 RepID=A0A8J6E8F6_ELECQ|nr:hypothetical protein GDO78_015917 [Eleutherodactylus coqui]
MGDGHIITFQQGNFFLLCFIRAELCSGSVTTPPSGPHSHGQDLMRFDSSLNLQSHSMQVNGEFYSLLTCSTENSAQHFDLATRK